MFGRTIDDAVVDVPVAPVTPIAPVAPVALVARAAALFAGRLDLEVVDPVARRLDLGPRAPGAALTARRFEFCGRTPAIATDCWSWSAGRTTVKTGAMDARSGGRELCGRARVALLPYVASASRTCACSAGVSLEI